MTARRCSVKGCKGAHYGRGFCRAHYMRWRRNGEPGGRLPNGCVSRRRSSAELVLQPRVTG